MVFISTLIWMLTMFGFVPSAHADALNGALSRIGPLLYLKTEKGPLRLSSSLPEGEKTLARLESGDSIIATGLINETDQSAVVETIDFVGLRRLLGVWNTVNSKGVLQFNSYTDVDVYSFIIPTSGGFNPVRAPRSFKYALSPEANGAWILFLSDERSTQMGLLTIDDNAAVLNLLNSQTGDVNQTLRLQKVGP